MKQLLDQLFATWLRTFLFFFILWFGITITVGTLFSGFHFEDDQDIIQLNDEVRLENKGIVQTYIKWQKRDFETRFRPFFYLPKVFEAAAIGAYFPAWAAIVALQCIVACYFLFRFCRLVNFSIAHSLLFTIFTTVGVQTSAFWRLLTAEPLALVFLSMALVFMIKGLQNKTIKKRNDSIFLVLMFFSSLCKENIMMMLPSVAFLYSWIYSKEYKTTIIQAIKKNIQITIVLAIICLSEFFITWKIIGLNKTGFAGADDNYLNITKAWSLLYVYGIKNLLFLIPLLGFIYVFIKKRIKQSALKHQNAIIFSLLVIIPQFVLYFKSGINERYLLPGITGICFLNIYTLYQFNKQQNLTKLMRFSISVLLITVLSVNVFRMLVRGYLYGEEGRVTKEYLTSIIQHTDTSSCIVIVGHPIVKQACPLAAYLRSIPIGRKNVYIFSDFYTYTPFEIAVAKEEQQRYFGDNMFEQIQDKRKISTVAVYQELEERMLNELKWFNVSEFERKEFGRDLFMGSPSYGKMIYYYRK